MSRQPTHQSLYTVSIHVTAKDIMGITIIQADAFASTVLAASEAEARGVFVPVQIAAQQAGKKCELTVSRVDDDVILEAARQIQARRGNPG